MKDLIIKNTPKTPEIHFDCSSGVFLVSGVSVPENSMAFYKVIILWLKEYVKNPAPATKVVFKLSYVNTSSLQFIYDLLKQLDNLSDKLSNRSVEWYYLEEDIDMQEMGEDFRDAIGIDFAFFEVEDV